MACGTAVIANSQCGANVGRLVDNHCTTLYYSPKDLHSHVWTTTQSPGCVPVFFHVLHQVFSKVTEGKGRGGSGGAGRWRSGVKGID